MFIHNQLLQEGGLIMQIIIEEELIMTKLDDEIALLHMKTGKYYSLKGTGVRMWELLQIHKETEKVFSCILDEYNVSEKNLRRDFDHLLEQLKSAQLVIPA